MRVHTTYLIYRQNNQLTQAGLDSMQEGSTEREDAIGPYRHERKIIRFPQTTSEEEIYQELKKLDKSTFSRAKIYADMTCAAQLHRIIGHHHTHIIGQAGRVEDFVKYVEKLRPSHIILVKECLSCHFSKEEGFLSLEEVAQMREQTRTAADEDTVRAVANMWEGAGNKAVADAFRKVFDGRITVVANEAEAYIAYQTMPQALLVADHHALRGGPMPYGWWEDVDYARVPIYTERIHWM